MKKQTTTPPAAAERLIDTRFKQYTAVYNTGTKRTILSISSLMLMLGIMGLLWAAPFPHIAFLGKYNGFINWASFFMAVVGFYYYRLSPTICYLIILLLFAFSYVVTLLIDWEHKGGFSVQIISGCLVGAALLMAVLINKKLSGKLTVGMALNHYLLSPAWFMAMVLKKLVGRY